MTCPWVATKLLSAAERTMLHPESMRPGRNFAQDETQVLEQIKNHPPVDDNHGQTPTVGV